MSRPGSFRKYIFHASRNRAIDVIRRRKTTERVRATLLDQITSSPSLKSAETSAKDKEEIVALNEALFDLSTEERETITLKIYSDLSFREIAETTSTPIGTVASRYRIALGKLREKLGAHANG